MRKTLIFILTTLFVASPALGQEYEQDVHYFQMTKPQPVHTGENIEVLELFWYRCPHCYTLEPYLKQWEKSKPDFVEYVRMPAILNQPWAFDARVFYTFLALGLVDKLHEAYFDAIHKERKRFVTVEQLADWAADQDVDPQDILNTFNSFGVNSMVAHAADMSARYQTDGVPTIIIDGKYRTKVSLAGGHNELIDLMNHLALRARSERSD
ncbi:MAG: disulfide bond formation protein DsbA [Acidiferrobacteraceae bacterium]|jgi:thiol:disulfide interchange protein DsbA|nr:disulfide bond formation protein DsbA [Acidiferrobacteraceae bacterium]MDP6530878.1 thiol:disulfide interchange protein DsbA/DsbL [Arenicellales bacterium]MDP6854303.1 thiol:disulfide interchange protein DsbA/DsbL [Arenicellales bacterium]MDP6948276.1 thiol:disulfide interchange protein DsbA/DsbL [Arenicellales bacterium]HCY12521.1 disulfide bond formation protein DsbA [Gammaproteobacteria bacterium]|tara:strand:+ start:17880 stop:18509 length:630 start_codon:yes stop_codon:yes gene_type:complete